ncbi:clostripain-related cysteine peptidase [Burkholderia sp. LMG 32019]|uniref:clostripain-related cysteine peptidase n=1 Tax=Burkholderia sp. LMG 32019 TaxID=3158173 RepID=UPI003C2AD843
MGKRWCMTWRRIGWLLVGFALSGLMSACGSGDESITATAERTVLVYLVGANLTSSLQDDLDAMAKATAGTNVNILVTTGGGDRMQEDVDWTRTQRWQLSQGRRTWLADLGQQDMAASATLSDFLEWGIRQYPAKRVAVILGDHGGGPNGGFGYRTTTKAEDDAQERPHLSLRDMTQAFQRATAATGKRFDLVGFDACLMASVEVAAAFRPYADYLVASEDLEFGGWDYASVFGGLAAQPDMNARDLGTLIVNSYADLRAEGNPDLTISLVDLGALDSVIGVADALGRGLYANGTSVEDIARARVNARSFDTDWTTVNDMVDLVQFSRALELAALPKPTVASSEVEKALSQAVVVKRAGSNRSLAKGLTIFMPAGAAYNATVMQTYDSLDFSTSYQSFVGEYGAALRAALDVLVQISPPAATGDDVQAFAYSPKLWQEEVPMAALGDNLGQIVAFRPIGPASPAGDTNLGGDFRKLSTKLSEPWYALNGCIVSVIPGVTGDTETSFVIPVSYRDEGSTADVTGFLLASGGPGGDMTLEGFVPSLGTAVGHVTSIGPKWTLTPQLWSAAQSMWYPPPPETVVCKAVAAQDGSWKIGRIEKPKSYRFRFAVADLANRLRLSPEMEPVPPGEEQVP